MKNTQKNFSDLINKYQTKIKKVWQVIKEGLGEEQVNRQFLIEKILQKILWNKILQILSPLPLTLIAFLLKLVQA